MDAKLMTQRKKKGSIQIIYFFYFFNLN